MFDHITYRWSELLATVYITDRLSQPRRDAGYQYLAHAFAEHRQMSVCGQVPRSSSAGHEGDAQKCPACLKKLGLDKMGEAQ